MPSIDRHEIHDRQNRDQETVARSYGGETRVRQQLESLRLYFERWNGSESGFEDWLKVEFVAAVGSLVADIKGSGSGQRRPDLRLVLSTGEIIPVELKGSTNWAPTHDHTWEHYAGKLLFFICGTETAREQLRLAEVTAQDPSAGFIKLLEVSRPARAGRHAVILGVVDVPIGDEG